MRVERRDELFSPCVQKLWFFLYEEGGPIICNRLRHYNATDCDVKPLKIGQGKTLAYIKILSNPMK